jgi:hypothetical protein
MQPSFNMQQRRLCNHSILPDAGGLAALQAQAPQQLPRAVGPARKDGPGPRCVQRREEGLLLVQLRGLLQGRPGKRNGAIDEKRFKVCHTRVPPRRSRVTLFAAEHSSAGQL